MSHTIGAPSTEPPHGRGPVSAVMGELLWRLAVRQWREHMRGDPPPDRAATGLAGGARGSRCGRCGQLWPCSGRRLAELGLGAVGVRVAP